MSSTVHRAEIPSLHVAYSRKSVVVYFGRTLSVQNRDPECLKATNKSAQGATHKSTHEEMPVSSQDQHSSSDQEPDLEITFKPPRRPQPVPSMFIPYIEGPKMDWRVNDGLYHRFLK